jgi:tetratricopeptide repeat protein/NB-ARC domain-containing protein
MPDLAADREGINRTSNTQLSHVTAGGDISLDQRMVFENVEHLVVPRRQQPALAKPIKVAARPLHLVGRHGLLADLRARLVAEGPEPRLIALHGLGGVGKTSLAVEYAHRHLQEYGLVWHLPAEDPTTLSARFAELAAVLDVRDLVDSTDPVVQVHAALAERTDRWLLLLDNVVDAESIRDVVPPAGNGHILLTTRSAHWPHALALEVPVLDRGVAAEFLSARTTDPDLAAAAKLADELGSLPLALEQAAAYLLATGGTVAGYIDRLRVQRAELLRRGEPWGYPVTVATTWEMAFQRLQVSDPAAITLLRLLACYAPESIPIGQLLVHRALSSVAAPAEDVERFVRDAFALDDAIVALRRFSLISPPRDGTVTIHRLVQAVTLDQLSEDRRLAWRDIAAALLEAALPDDTRRREDWPTFAELLAHARTALALDAPGMAKIVDYLEAIGDYATAMIIQEEIYADALNRLGAEDPVTLAAHADWARWVGHSGDPFRARGMFEAIVAARLRVSGAEDVATLDAMAHLADWTGQCGDQERARDMCAELLAVRRRVVGAEDPGTLWVWHQLGFWTGQAGDVLGARDHYAAVLPIRERVLGHEHSDTLSTRDHYARWVGEAGDPVRARDMCADLLPVYERVAGPEHPDTLWCRNNLATWTGAAGDPAAARAQFAQLVAMRERVSGVEHPATLIAKRDLATWTGKAGDAAGARDLFAQLLPVVERTYGPEHPETIATRENQSHWAQVSNGSAG